MEKWTWKRKKKSVKVVIVRRVSEALGFSGKSFVSLYIVGFA